MMTHRAQKCWNHGKNTNNDRNNQPGSLKVKGHTNQWGFFQTPLCHFFIPESLKPARHLQSGPTHPAVCFSFKYYRYLVNFKYFSNCHYVFGFWLWSPWLIFGYVVFKSEYNMKRKDLCALVSAISKGDNFSSEMSSLFLKMDHIKGVILAKVMKDRKPALSTGWGLNIKQT